MRYFITFLETVLIIICFCNPLPAQVDTSSISETRNYVRDIDSINEIDYVQDKGFMRSIADGIIKNERGKIIGGFGIYTLSNSKGDSAFRIEYHTNLPINIYKIYYFKLDKLVYATLELQEVNSTQKTFYRKEEFYDNGNIVWKTTSKERTADRYSGETNFSLYRDGLKFLAEFKTQNNR